MSPVRVEFVALMAFMTSIIALAIDSILPAFSTIGTDLRVSSSDDMQLIIAVLFFGFGLGQLIFGPLSDAFGRKPPIYWGMFIFMIGAALSGFAPNFSLFILGRFLQGLGGAAPRIISIALVRDEYSGNAMARITSLIMTIFILVPAIAPALGQGILFIANWRAIFVVLFLFALVIWIWFAQRQPETLPKESRKNFSLQYIYQASQETFSQKSTVAAIWMSGLLFGIFVGYLGAVQDIFANIFQITTQFPAYFAVLALSIGSASFFNARLVMALGMRRLIFLAFLGMATLSSLFALYFGYISPGAPPLFVFMPYMCVTFFSVGFLFGNLNALGMEPLGRIAGIGSAILGFTQSTISATAGIFLGRYYHHDVSNLALSFAVVAVICLMILSWEGTRSSVSGLQS